MNIYEKLIELRKAAKGFTKDKKGFGYDYVSGNQILEKIRGKVNELGLWLQPYVNVGEHEKFEYTNDKGKEKVDFIVKGEMRYFWINAENPEERVHVEWAYYGQQDDISKAFGSGLTYSERYFLLKSLGLPTDSDDPDARDTRGKASVKKEAEETDKALYHCKECGKPFKPTLVNGTFYTSRMLHDEAKRTRGEALCRECNAAKLNESFQADLDGAGK